MAETNGGDRLGVALSGGGHRASCWAAGAVVGLVDAGVAGDIVSVSSVSGGSITNGVLAASEPDAWTTGSEEAEAALAPGLRQWAHDGLFFPGPATDGWVAVTLGLVAAALGGVLAALAASVAARREWSDGRAATVALVLLVLLVGVAAFLVWKLKTAPVVSVAILVGAALVWPFTFLAMSAVRTTWQWLPLIWVAAIVLFVLAIRRFGRRSEAAVAGLEATLFPKERTLGSLEDRTVHHVLCATNLRTGNNLYLTNRVTWGHDVPARAGAVTVATAVQASACLPGAFLARTIDGIDGPGSPTVVLSDGGAYDNMADQWEWGFPNRQKYAKDLPDGAALLTRAQPDGASHLVVVNASRGMSGSSDKRTKPGLRGELGSALGAKDVLYDVSTATRRRLLIEMFDRARQDPAAGGHAGILIHIGTSPYVIVEKFGKAPGPIGDRARAGKLVLDALTDQERGAPGTDEQREDWWLDVARRNSGVKTTLAPLERIEVGSSARLLHHAWVLTRLTGYVVHDWGDLPDPAGDLSAWRSTRFEQLVEASRTAPVTVGG